jgi:5,10-methylenetetrahydromethanopterin reductase
VLPVTNAVATQRLGLIFAGAPRVPEMVELACRAEDRGFESVWMAETRITRDAVSPVAAIAQATKRIKVGTGIMNVYTRGAVVIAITFNGLDEIAPGRIIMGLGAGSPLILAPQGVSWDRPVKRLREYVDVIRPLMRGEAVTYHGDMVHLDGARIEDILAGDGGISTAAQMPLYLGVTGRPALELAGELADGVLMNVCLPTSYVERSMEALDRGARKAGRSLGELDIGMAMLASPHDDPAVGRDGARRFIALYLSMFPNIAKETGLAEPFMASVRETFHAEGLDAAAQRVGDDVVDLLAAAGTPEECRARIEEYRRAGVALPVLISVEGAIESVIDELAP